MPSSPKRPPTIIIYYRKKYNYFHQNIQKSCNSSDFGFLLQASSHTAGISGRTARSDQDPAVSVF